MTTYYCMHCKTLRELIGRRSRGHDDASHEREARL